MRVYQWVLRATTDMKVEVLANDLEEARRLGREDLEMRLGVKRQNLLDKISSFEAQPNEVIREMMTNIYRAYIRDFDRLAEDLKVCRKSGVMWDLEEVNPKLEVVGPLYGDEGND